jgi:hypothetical protein
MRRFDTVPAEHHGEAKQGHSPATRSKHKENVVGLNDVSAL